MSSSPPGNLPSRTFVAISHADAALTRISLLPSEISRRARGLNEGEALKHHRSVCVSRRKRMASFPAIELFRREWFEEFGADHEFAFQQTEFPPALAATDGNESNYRIFTARDYDFLAHTCFLNQPRESRFGFVNADGFHVLANNILAKQ